MGKLKEHLIQKKNGLLVSLFMLLSILQPDIVYAADDVQGKIEGALGSVKTVLTGLIVTVGIVVALWIIIKRMPSADDPQEKNEVYKAVGRVLGLVAIGAAIVWVVPWVYDLFQ